jgi:hypothetical protein
MTQDIFRKAHCTTLVIIPNSRYAPQGHLAPPARPVAKLEEKSQPDSCEAVRYYHILGDLHLGIYYEWDLIVPRGEMGVTQGGIQPAQGDNLILIERSCFGGWGSRRTAWISTFMKVIPLPKASAEKGDEASILLE